MGRKEYYDDPHAPKPNSIVVAVTAFVQDDIGRILLIQRSDNGLWALPGGTQDIGENVARTAERQTREETGYDVRVTGIVGVYSDPRHVIAYDDGEVCQQFALCFRTELLGGHMTPGRESPKVRWLAPEDVRQLPMHPSTRLRVTHGLERRSDPHIG